MERIRALWNRGPLGKAIVSLVALVVLCCVIGILVPRTPRQSAAPTAAPAAAVAAATAAPPTEPPAPTAAVRATIGPTPTDLPLPTDPPTPEPTLTALIEPTATLEEPTSLPKPTETAAVPVAQPEPTAAPVASGPTYHGSGSSQTVDPPWWPCEKGQIKGNRNSNIYHVPTGRSYAKTFKNVQCFNTGAEAEAAGYRAAKN